MNWLRGQQAVWRRHPWVLGLWLLAFAAAIIMIVAIPTVGFDSFAFNAALAGSLILQGIHGWVVRRYERCDRRVGEAPVRPA